jgi:Xaa-Pro dipeptidase
VTTEFVTTESLLRPVVEVSSFSVDISSDRRGDIDTKQAHIGALLRESGREGVLLLEPENVAWLTAGAQPRGVLDPSTAPALFCTPEGRWAITCNTDTQRLFDEELDGLGFQLKEWPWHWGREQFLCDLCHNRKILTDRLPGVAGDFQLLEEMRKLRRVLTPYEQACLLALGQTVAHALEATCRTMAHKENEREVAGQLSHRLIHRGVHPVHVGVAADGRSKDYRRHAFTPTVIDKYAVLTATGRKYGLCVTASRTVCFGEIPEELKNAHSAVCRVVASYLASTWPDAVPREVLTAGRRIYAISGFEHEWLLAPQGHVTGRLPIELQITPQTTDLFEPHLAVTWSASAGPAVSCDTFLVTENGPKVVTAPEIWPLKRIKIQGAECLRADVMVRS